MNRIDLMRKYISSQAKEILIIRDTKYTGVEGEPLIGWAEDGTFNENGCFGGMQGDKALLADMELYYDLTACYWDFPIKLVEGVFLFDESEQAYKQIV